MMAAAPGSISLAQASAQFADFAAPEPEGAQRFPARASDIAPRLFARAAEGAPRHAEVPAFPGTPFTALRRELVGLSELRREDLSLVDGGTVALIALAFGPPRLWGYLLDTAIDAFHDGYWQAGEVSLSTRVHHGMRAATDGVRTNVEALIDRCSADVALLALTLDEATLQVQASGPLHAYVARRRGVRRLGPRMLGVQPEESADGLLTSPATTCAEQLEPGDLVFAGSRRVCHEAALQRVSRMLERDHFSLARTSARFEAESPQAVLTLLSASAGEEGRGAATLAFRMP